MDNNEFENTQNTNADNPITDENDTVLENKSEEPAVEAEEPAAEAEEPAVEVEEPAVEVEEPAAEAEETVAEAEEPAVEAEEPAVEVEEPAAEAEEPVAEAEEPVAEAEEPAVEAEEPEVEAGEEPTPAPLPKKKGISIKFIAIVAAAAVALAALVIGGIFFYINCISMPDPVSSVVTTVVQKYSISNTNYQFGDMEKAGTVNIKGGLDQNNMFGLPEMSADISIAYNEEAVKVGGEIIGEKFDAYMSDKEVAIKLNGFDKNYYGVSFEKFVDDFKKSVFAPKSGTEFALDKETYNAICDFVESINNADEESEQIQKDLTTIFDFIKEPGGVSLFEEIEDDFGEKKINGKKRSARSRTYVITEESVVAYFNALADAMEDADENVIEAAERLVSRVNVTLSGSSVSEWDDLCDEVKSYAKSIKKSIEEFELEIEICYVGSDVSAIIVDFSAEEWMGNEDYETEIVVDFGEDPMNSIDTVITVNTSFEFDGEDVKTGGTVSLTENKEKDITTYVLSIEDENQEVIVSWTLDTDDDEAVLDIKIIENKEERSVLALVFDYEDSKDRWSIAFKKMTVLVPDIDEDADPEDEDNWKMAEVTYKAKDIGLDISISVEQGAEDMSAPKYKNVLKLDEDDITEKIAELQEYFSEITEKFGAAQEPLE